MESSDDSDDNEAETDGPPNKREIEDELDALPEMSNDWSYLD